MSQRGDAPFRTIGDALQQAPVGSRILVRPGKYGERLVLGRPVELIGETAGGAVIVSRFDAGCLLVQAESSLVRGLTFRCRAGVRTFAAIDIARSRLTLEDCEITSDTSAAVAIHGP